MRTRAVSCSFALMTPAYATDTDATHSRAPSLGSQRRASLPGGFPEFAAPPTSSTVQEISHSRAMDGLANAGQQNGAQDNYHHPSAASLSAAPLYQAYPFLAHMHTKPPPPTLQCSISPLFTPDNYDWAMAAAAVAGWANPSMQSHHPLSPSPQHQPYYPPYNPYGPPVSSYLQHPFGPTMHPALESTVNLYHPHQLQHLPHGPLSPPFTPGLQSPLYHVDPAYSRASPSALAMPLAFPAYGHGAYPFSVPSLSTSPVPRHLSAASSVEESDDSSSLSAMNAGPPAPKSIVARWQEGAFFSYGYVKFFDAVKGYGFIIDQGMPELGGRDLFVHYTAIQGIKKGFRFLCPSEWVEYNLTINSAGRMQLLNLYGFNGMPRPSPARALLSPSLPFSQLDKETVASPAQAIAEAKISTGTGPRRRSGVNAGTAEVEDGASGPPSAASAAVPSTPDPTQTLVVVKTTAPAGARGKNHGSRGLIGVGIEVIGWTATRMLCRHLVWSTHRLGTDETEECVTSHAGTDAIPRAAPAATKTTLRGRRIPGSVKATASSSVVTPALSALLESCPFSALADT
ncbi:hypothetical protein JCM21900_002886 [Sporobolomyces salmonicolor]